MDDIIFNNNWDDASPQTVSSTLTPLSAIDLLYTILFGLVTACVIAPPTEVVSAGLTIENLFSSFLGSEQLHFVYYHIKRTTLVRLVHSFLPIAYYLYMCQMSSSVRFLHFSSLFGVWELWSILSILLPGLALLQSHRWYQGGWSAHPVVQRLTAASNGQSWRAVATSINIEFRRPDKFVTGALASRKVVVTDNWILVTSIYNLSVAHQSDALLTVEKCEDHALSHESSSEDQGVQILNIAVNSVNTRRLYFRMRLNALDYQDIKDKLTAPLRHAQGVVVRQSLSEKFIDAFRNQVNENRRFVKPSDMEVEQCIGCMQHPADVKLVKACAQGTRGECATCFCRPMWCLSCLARWFASRQVEAGHEPNTWMIRRAMCPTCRSFFCVLDVSWLDTVPGQPVGGSS